VNPHGDEPPCYSYKPRYPQGAVQSGLGGFSRLCMNSRGVYPAAGNASHELCARQLYFFHLLHCHIQHPISVMFFLVVNISYHCRQILFAK